MRTIISCLAALAITFCGNAVDIKKTAPVKNASGLPNGFFVFSVKEGLYKSNLKNYEPAKIPNTGGDPKFPEISDDGKWILYLENMSDLYLIKPDGAGKTKVPVSTGGCIRGAGFVRSSPVGSELFYLLSEPCEDGLLGNVLKARIVDLSGSAPTFGAERQLHEKLTIGSRVSWSYFNTNHEQTLCVSANHIYGVIRYPYMVTIPDGGKGIATRENDYVSTFGGFNCGCDMANDGKITCQNLNNQIATIDHPVGHKGPCLFNFKEKGEGKFSGAEDMISANWVPDKYRDMDKNDWHFWDFSNHPHYILGVNQGARNTDFAGYSINDAGTSSDGIGIWMLKWTTNEWFRVSSAGVRSKWVASYISGEVGAGKAYERYTNMNAIARTQFTIVSQDYRQQFLPSLVNGWQIIMPNGRVIRKQY